MTSEHQEPVRSGRVPRAEVRERLLAAAITCFGERGIHETRLDDIAARAGFSKGAVYSNFDSKDALVAELMRRWTSAVLDSVRSFVRPEVAAEDLSDVIRAAFAPFSQAANFVLLSEFRGHAIRHPDVLPLFQRQRQALQDGVREVVELWFAQHPELDTGLPAGTLATVLIAANVGIAFDAPVLPDVEPGEVLAQLVGALVRRT